MCPISGHGTHQQIPHFPIPFWWCMYAVTMIRRWTWHDVWVEFHGVNESSDDDGISSNRSCTRDFSSSSVVSLPHLHWKKKKKKKKMKKKKKKKSLNCPLHLSLLQTYWNPWVAKPSTWVGCVTYWHISLHSKSTRAHIHRQSCLECWHTSPFSHTYCTSSSSTTCALRHTHLYLGTHTHTQEHTSLWNSTVFDHKDI